MNGRFDYLDSEVDDLLGTGDVPVVRGHHHRLPRRCAFRVENEPVRRGRRLQRPGRLRRVDRVEQAGKSGVGELGVDDRLRRVRQRHHPVPTFTQAGQRGGDLGMRGQPAHRGTDVTDPGVVQWGAVRLGDRPCTGRADLPEIAVLPRRHGGQRSVDHQVEPGPAELRRAGVPREHLVQR